MVVRINQLDLPAVPDAAGWPDHPLAGPLQCRWPPDTKLFEVLILDQDEQQRKLLDDFRRQQLRKLIATAAEALREGNEQLLVRLDGVLAKGELHAGLDQILTYDQPLRYAISSIRKLDPAAPAVSASVRAALSPNLLTQLCANESVGLERTVRVRVFSVEQSLVDPLLDIDSVEDERWGEILAGSGCILSTSLGLGSLQIVSRKFDATTIRARLTQALLRSSREGTFGQTG